jgi:hypothetical protein
MSRVGLVVAATAAVMGVALAGCSGSTPALPNWMSPTPSPPQLQTLRFESDPLGADVRTAQGQTCQTPCALAVPSESQPVTFAKIGFVPQTVQVSAGEPPEHHFWESPPPALTPNPVVVTLQAVPPPVKSKRRRRKSAALTRTATKIGAPRRTSTTAPAQRAPKDPFPPPPPFQQPAASPFPPPPPTR